MIILQTDRHKYKVLTDKTLIGVSLDIQGGKPIPVRRVHDLEPKLLRLILSPRSQWELYEVKDD